MSFFAGLLQRHFTFEAVVVCVVLIDYLYFSHGDYVLRFLLVLTL